MKSYLAFAFNLVPWLAISAQVQPFAQKMGPAIGTSVPAIQATDQNGKTQKLDSLRGPKGTILLFIRSADW